MKQFEVTFIVDPVLSGDDLKSTVSTYTDMIKNEGCKIIAIDELGLKQLAYDIKKRSTGIYYTVEFQSENGLVIDKLELALRRDERIMRFLTVSLDKFGIKYNADKREGKIGKVKEKVKPEEPKPYSPPARPAHKPRPEPDQEATTDVAAEEVAVTDAPESN